jgi:hypothetical protein
MRILFDISKIDSLLNFSDKKNIGIVNRELKNNNNDNFLYSHLHNFVLTITVLGKITFQEISILNILL